LLAAAAGIGSGVVYSTTLAPTVASSRDSAELALAAITAGVAHPTGYPLYTLLGRLWVSVIPIGDPGWRLNLFSALCSALAVALFAVALLRLVRSFSAAWLGAMVLALSPVFWFESTVAEVYPLHMLLQSAILWSWIRWEESDGQRGLGLLVFSIGLSFTHHLMTVLILPCVGLAMLLRAPSWWSARTIARLALLFVLPLGLYAYLPIALAGSPQICWTDLSTPQALFEHVTGGSYGSAVVGALDEAFQTKLGRYPRGLLRQFGPVLLLVPLGLWGLRRRPRVLLPLLVGYLGATYFALSYQVIDPDAFYLPSCLFLGVWIASGAAFLLRSTWAAMPRARRAAAAAFLVLPGLSLVQNFSVGDRRNDHRVYDRDMAAMALAEENAVLLVWGDSNFPLYASLVHGIRPDLEVIPLRLTIRCSYPPELQAIRRDREQSEADRLAATLAAVQQLGGMDRTLVALPVEAGSGWEEFGLHLREQGAINSLVSAFPSSAVAGPVRSRLNAPAIFADGLELLELRLAVPEAQQGDIVELDYFWRPGAPVAEGTRIVTFFGTAEGGPVLGRRQSAHPDLAHRLGQGVPYAELSVGQVFRERVALRVPYDLPVGEWTLWVGVATPQGPAALASGELRTPAATLVVREGKRELWRLPTIHRASSVGAGVTAVH
jgi:4-amino-4-deoxy-L-arabinose transferase-like glycosyltransferase